MRRAGAVAGVAFVLLTATGCPGTNLDREVELAEVQHDVEGERLDAEAYVPSDAEPAARPPLISEFEVRGAFEYGWEMSCNSVFAYTPDGNRYYDDVAYDYDDCVGLLEVDMPQLIDALADSRDVSGDAEKVGRVVALDAVFEQFAPVLCYGEDCVTRGDFAPY